MSFFMTVSREVDCYAFWNSSALRLTATAFLPILLILCAVEQILWYDEKEQIE